MKYLAEERPESYSCLLLISSITDLWVGHVVQNSCFAEFWFSLSFLMEGDFLS